MEEGFTYFGIFIESETNVVILHVLLVFLIGVLVSTLVARAPKIVPTHLQSSVEMFMQFVVDMGTDTMGAEKSKKYMPLIATIGLLVFLSNIIGIIPGFESPTANINFTIVLSLCVFFYYNFEGIREQGVIKYFKHFLGPVMWLAPLMCPIEVVSHLSRIISLAFRLFGNIKGDDMFLIVMLMLAPWLAPLPAFAILTFMAFLQSFVFMILSYVYIASAVIVEEEH